MGTDNFLHGRTFNTSYEEKFTERNRTDEILISYCLTGNKDITWTNIFYSFHPKKGNDATMTQEVTDSERDWENEMK